MASRRDVLRLGGGTAVYGLPLLLGLPACRQGWSCEKSDAAIDARPLKATAEARGLHFGTAVDRNTLESDPRYTETVIAECSLITPENSMKWKSLQPTPERYDFENADWLVAFAEKNGLEVHGHTLAWHYQMPDWFEAKVDAGNAEKFLVDHIETVAGRYAGRIRSWDVVNEAIDPESGRDDGLGVTPWLERLGPGYIDLAFHAAAEADPDAILVYNDYGIEYEGGWFEDRRNHLLDLLSGMVERDVPIHALGVQSHLYGGKSTDFARFARFLSDVTALGLDLMVTELDVRDHKLPADEAERDCRVAAVYEAYLDVMLDQKRLRSISVWGLSDRYSWLSEFEPRDDGKLVRPLPFDGDMNLKPAWHAIAKALSR